MRITAIIARLSMGLMFLFAAVAVLFSLMPQPELISDVKIFMVGMYVSGY